MNNYSAYLKKVNNCDIDDPVLSQTPLGKCLSSIPLYQAANQSNLVDLMQALNIEQLIPTDSGLARDYRGLAELMGFNSSEIETNFKRSPNPIKSLINAYQSRKEQQQPIVTLISLIKCIEHIERFDVLDDLIPTLISIAEGSIKIPTVNIQTRELTVSRREENASSKVIEDLDRLTVDDTPQSTIYYDAFICYAPEDFEHAQELMSIIRCCDARAKLATADDLLPGHFEHDALIRLIDKRCKKVIIILTPNFARSRECEFQTKFATEIGIKERYPKIIPVIYESFDEGELPSMIQVISKINMTDRAGFLWQMSVNKLLRSLELRMRNDHDIGVHERQVPQPSTSGNQNSNDPIVDLLYSRSSGASPSNNWPAIEDLPRASSPSKSMSWLKSFKKRMMGDSAGTTSKMMLIGDEDNEQINGNI